MWQLKPILTYNTISQKLRFLKNCPKSCELRTFAEVFWPRKVAAQKSIDFWDSWPSMSIKACAPFFQWMRSVYF